MTASICTAQQEKALNKMGATYFPSPNKSSKVVLVLGWMGSNARHLAFCYNNIVDICDIIFKSIWMLPAMSFPLYRPFPNSFLPAFATSKHKHCATICKTYLPVIPICKPCIFMPWATMAEWFYPTCCPCLKKPFPCKEWLPNPFPVRNSKMLAFIVYWVDWTRRQRVANRLILQAFPIGMCDAQHSCSCTWCGFGFGCPVACPHITLGSTRNPVIINIWLRSALRQPRYKKMLHN